MSAPAIYHYDPKTGELLGASSADIDPVGTKTAGEPRYFGPPAYATLDAPPAPQEGRARCFIDGAWVQVDDHRGETVYAKESGRAVEIKEPGPLPDSVTAKPRPSELHKFEDGDWVEDAALKKQTETAQAEAALSEIDRASVAAIRQALIEIGEGRAAPTVAVAALKALEAEALPHRAKVEAAK